MAISAPYKPARLFSADQQAHPATVTSPKLHLDESAKTADITWHDRLAPVFSYFGGSARLLQNGNVEFDGAPQCQYQPLTRQSLKSPKQPHPSLFGRCKSPDKTLTAAFACLVSIPRRSGKFLAIRI
jgi:hypothetical protein